MKIKELKQARDNIAAAFNLPPEAAARIVGHCNSMNTQDEVQKLVAGDFSSVQKIMDELGITADPVTVTKESKPQKITAAERGEIMEQASGVPSVAGEIVENNNELPVGFADTVRGWLEAWADFEGVELNKLHAQQWRAVCMYIGQKIKQNKILIDNKYIAAHGGRAYSGEKLEELLQLWAYLCGTLKQVPLVSDFVSFSGVSSSYFYDYQGRGLSSTSVAILQKAKQIEEGGLGSSVAGGGSGTIGGIFLLKTRHGYSETVTVQHTTGAAAVGVTELPKLTDTAGES